MKHVLLTPLAAVLSVVPLAAPAAVLGPYASDADTIALYHFNETAGASDPGNPIVNGGTGGTTLNFTNTGGPDGRNNLTTGGYGAPSVSGFGSSFNVLASGDGTYHSGGSGSAVGGGARTGGNVLQSGLQGLDGAFTLEALVYFNSFSTLNEYTIISHDGANGNRGFSFRIEAGSLLSFYSGGISTTLTTALPSSGAHAFGTNEWFHVAFTYTGDPLASNNASFYWTALDSAATQANLLSTGTLTADLAGTSNNPLGIGTITRSAFRLELDGFIDEVRISGVARGVDDFLFGTVPEPSSALLIALSGLALTVARRRRG